MSNSQRLKGARFERELAAFFREQGIEARRGFTYYHQSDVVGIPGIHVEAKFQETGKPREWMRQATEEAEKRKDGAPTVFWKKSRERVLVTMYLEDWITLYKEAKNVTERNGIETLAESNEEGHLFGGGV